MGNEPVEKAYGAGLGHIPEAGRRSSAGPPPFGGLLRACELHQGRLSRRDLFRLGLGACGALTAGLSTGCGWQVAACREVPANFFVDRGRPLLVVVHGEELEAMLRAGVEALGGLDRLTRLGREALFRANYVARQPYPVTTSAEFVGAVADLVRQSGFQRTVLFDSHGTHLTADGSPEAIMRKLGVFEQVRPHGVDIVARDFLDPDEFRLVRNPEWRIALPVGVHRMLSEAGAIISLPVLKRHNATRFTCALKMHFGSVSLADRFVAHKEGARGNVDFLDQRLVHFADAVKPQLNIVDARAVLTRSGPTLSGGAEVVRGVRRIILCGDMVATDAYCTRLMAECDATFSVEMVASQLRHATALGLGTADLERVRVVEIRT